MSSVFVLKREGNYLAGDNGHVFGVFDNRPAAMTAMLNNVEHLGDEELVVIDEFRLGEFNHDVG